MVTMGSAETNMQTFIGFIAVILAAGNAVGGYVVTERMLEMFTSTSNRGGKS
jgi:NAD(P) transhydrogenase subunit alpha